MGTTVGGRIFAAVALTLAAIFAAGALVAEGRIRELGRHEVERRLSAVLAVLEERAAAGLAGDVDPEELHAGLRRLRLEGGIRVTVIRPSGEVIADTAADAPMENHGGRPEILAAAAGGRGSDARRSATTGWTTLDVARRLQQGSATLGFLRVAAPLESVEQEVAVLRNSLLVGGLGILLLGLAASGLIARRIARPLEEMERRATAFAAGDLEGRLAPEGPDEVARLASALNRMADHIRERIAAEHHVRGDLEAVLAGTPDGVLAVDAGERILFMNAGAARLLSLPAPLAAGATLWEAVRFPELERILRGALAGGRPDPRDASSPGQDGRTLEISAAPLAAGKGVVALLRDVTEVRRLERIRMDFVANVSHELRTPLAGIAGAIETLEDGGLDPVERRRFHEIARRNAERMRALVSDLLDLSALEAEERALPLEPLPLDRVVRACAASLGDLASRCQVTLAVEPPPKGDLTVAGHPRRLEQAILNLAENALKYTPAGGKVTMRILDRGGELSVEVQDTGIGIPEAALPRIFERFYRVDPSRSRGVGGTGLGLAIVKHVARAHRGRIEVRSVEGAGSTFILTLPRAAAAGAAS
jgi:two-component system phosphate regulon sensor histidine kinase PhoR